MANSNSQQIQLSSKENLREVAFKNKIQIMNFSNIWNTVFRIPYDIEVTIYLVHIIRGGTTFDLAKNMKEGVT